MRSSCVAACLLLLALSAQGHGGEHQNLGRIVGTLIDRDGAPVSAAFVSADNFSPTLTAAEPAQSAEHSSEKSNPPKHQRKWLEEDVSWIFSIPDAKTHADGSFEIKRLELGTYVLKGEKDEDAYPSADLTFTDGGQATVTLTADAPVVHVVVKMGAKGGIVSGSVTDKGTGEPVRASCSLFRADNNQQLLSSSAQPNFSFVMPAPLEVVMVLSAEGYHRLRVPVRLEPGRRQMLNLELEREVK